MHAGMAQNLVSRWEQWRELIGEAPAGRQRREVLRRLRTQPALLFCGDAWLSTPLGANLARHVAQHLDGLAMLVGKPRATVEELFAPVQVRALVSRLKGSPFDLLCLSAGTYDLVGARMASVFRPWALERRKPRLSPEAAFERVLETAFLERMRVRYDSLLQALAPRLRERPGFRVLTLCHAPWRRIGVAGELKTAPLGLLAELNEDPGPWLWKTMQFTLSDKAAARAFGELLVDGFRTRVLDPLVAAHPVLFSYLDFAPLAELAADSGWYDEIHPTEPSLAAMASLFADRIRELLPACKRSMER